MTVTVSNVVSGVASGVTTSFVTPNAITVNYGDLYLLSITTVGVSNQTRQTTSITSGYNTTWTQIGVTTSSKANPLTAITLWIGEVTGDATNATWTVNLATGSGTVDCIVCIDEAKGTSGLASAITNSTSLATDTTSPINMTLATMVTGSIPYAICALGTTASPVITNKTNWVTVTSSTRTSGTNNTAFRTSTIALDTDRTPSFTFSGTNPSAGAKSIELPAGTPASFLTNVAITTTNPTFAALINLQLTLPVSDNFNRADATPMGMPWINVSTNPIRIVSNRAQGPSAGRGLAYYVDTTWPNDQYSEGIAPVSGGNTNDSGPAVRINSGNNGYTYDVLNKTIEKIVNGVPTTLATLTDTPSTTAVYRLAVAGTKLEVFKDGVSLGSVTDSTFSSGAAGIQCSNATAIFDTWAGGVYSAAFTTNVAITTVKPTIAINAVQSNFTASVSVNTVKPTIAIGAAQSNFTASVSVNTISPTILVNAAQSNFTSSVSINTINPTISINAVQSNFTTAIAINTINPTITIGAAQSNFTASVAVNTINPIFVATIGAISSVNVSINTITPTFASNLVQSNFTSSIAVNTINPTISITALQSNFTVSVGITTLQPNFAIQLVPIFQTNIAILTSQPIFSATLTQSNFTASVGITTIIPTFAALLTPLTSISISLITINPIFNSIIIAQISNATINIQTSNPTFNAKIVDPFNIWINEQYNSSIWYNKSDDTSIWSNKSDATSIWIS